MSYVYKIVLDRQYDFLVLAIKNRFWDERQLCYILCRALSSQRVLLQEIQNIHLYSGSTASLPAVTVSQDPMIR